MAGGMPSGAAALEAVRQVLTKQNVFLANEPAVLLLGIFPDELKPHVYPTSCTRLFIAASFIIAQT